MEQAISRAKVLMEALPYIRDFRGKKIVVKYGGHAMVNPELKTLFAKQIVLFHYVGIQVVVVHGGGPQISRMLDTMGIESSFIDGKRVTDARTMDVVEMVLAGGINKEIVQLINADGGRAVGLSGKDGGLIKARKLLFSRRDASGNVTDIDMGHVGEVTGVDTGIIDAVEKGGFVAVIAPSGVGDDGLTYNINADTVAAEIARQLKVEKLIILTDEQGVLDAEGKLISSLKYSQINKLISSGVVKGGMIPKLECCMRALEGGVTKAHIIDGRIPYSILLELFTDSGIGTQIVKE
ncbi:MAG: Acetylglutamate kinase [Deltaproteobacteria bacterium ADurb.BinA179]|jgi:acetylglutamate kinase|nr:acetylglutamate kinase [Deltaproteobacteria bacterium]MDI9543019.1 acetylglutamate kinase [Pseudomonadota bacterium]NLW68463.1 acetylglutamate kinase [Bacteriovoracaceae bacterium]OPZ28025.1 MAG: Acetylglutamate kinase [Deltaproteobacteria bacterium ADurb.BinA179]HRR20807.1 acetylglutamate kinase [Desulfomonilia bacterium]